MTEWYDAMLKEDYDIDRRVNGEIQYRGTCAGGKEPICSSFEAIYSAYHDYRNSQQWN